MLRFLDLTDNVGYLKLVPGSLAFGAWLFEVVTRLPGPCAELAPGFGSRFHGLHSLFSNVGIEVLAVCAWLFKVDTELTAVWYLVF